MLPQLVYLLFGLASFTAASNNFHVTVEAQTKHCFVEPLNAGDFLGLSFQVFGGDNLDVDFWITNPDELIIQSAFRTSTGSFSVDAPKTGSYSYCISNLGHAGNTEKFVSFSINGPDEQRRILDKKSGAKDESKDSLAKEVQELTNAIQQVTDEQAYIRLRLLRHHETAESTNSRVLYWTFFEGLIIASVVGFQLVYITQFFQKSNRRMV
ncbi:endosomal protein P24B [Rhizoclosmatium globosum]|uniref:Endosomal protein P24B n=1 Tax=Rhizoclosmatium globosum TaxID=329046 RepID=A0A1Y2B284_9FUNG|nr:endosomal protein P24B [Rhizoclosmatium globosum]|eukprot:ORY28931.1 endosomal protein P24B [Rhizoclosmatium globosum]